MDLKELEQINGKEKSKNKSKGQTRDKGEKDTRPAVERARKSKRDVSEDPSSRQQPLNPHRA